jgi:hypothetical protein
MRSTTCIALLGAMVFGAVRVQAQTACDDDLIRQANDARRAGRTAEALPLLQRAWNTCHTPRALAQLGLAEAALERWADAERHLREALQSREDPWIARNLARLETALAEVRPHSAAEAPSPPAAPVTPPVASPPPTSPPLEAQQSPSAERPSRVPPARARGRRVLAWTSLTLGALSLGAATAALVLRNDAATTFNNDASCGANGGFVLGSSSCVGDYEDGYRMGIVSVSGFAAGGALMLASVLLFATLPSRPREAPQSHGFFCAPMLSSFGATCGAAL